jgi:LysM repeat protein
MSQRYGCFRRTKALYSNKAAKACTCKRIRKAPISIPEIESETDKSGVQIQPVNEPVEEKPKTEDTPTATDQEKSSTPPVETIIYTVKHGDTLESIARDTHVPKEEIIRKIT